jgi:hypothetical protein
VVPHSLAGKVTKRLEACCIRYRHGYGVPMMFPDKDIEKIEEERKHIMEVQFTFRIILKVIPE